MATIKKAQKGASTPKYKPSWPKPTADSTEYYKDKAADMRKAYTNTGNRKFAQEAGDAFRSEIRQKWKGKPGMDKNGFPIKQKFGGKTPSSPAQKKFASLAAPKDKITFADKIAGAKGKAPMAKKGTTMKKGGMMKKGC
jgi:hypothetical protein